MRKPFIVTLIVLSAIAVYCFNRSSLEPQQSQGDYIESGKVLRHSPQSGREIRERGTELKASENSAFSPPQRIPRNLQPFDQQAALLRNDPNALFPAAERLATTGLPEASYIQSLHNLFDEYAIIVKDGGYPTGLNVEITNALLGKNQQKVAVLPKSHPRINQAGELVDQWNTPYHFHLESLRVVTIRSAGPDQVFYSEDDVFFANE